MLAPKARTKLVRNFLFGHRQVITVRMFETIC